MKTFLVALLLFASSAEGALLRVVILGDSVARGAGDESGRGIAGNLPHAVTVNAAVNGSRTWEVFARLRGDAVRTVVASADVVVLSIGGNDLYGSRWEQLVSTLAPRLSMMLVRSRVAALVATLHAINGRARIVIVGLHNPYRELPLGAAVARWNAGLLERFADDRRVAVLPIADLFAGTDRRSSLDHFHPNAAAYAAIARRIAESL
jgi:lysophospholipase L1-like esterase